MKPRTEKNRSPGSSRAQHLPGTALQRVPALVTLGVALALFVVPGVPVLFLDTAAAFGASADVNDHQIEIVRLGSPRVLAPSEINKSKLKGF